MDEQTEPRGRPAICPTSWLVVLCGLASCDDATSPNVVADAVYPLKSCGGQDFGR